MNNASSALSVPITDLPAALQTHTFLHLPFQQQIRLLEAALPSHDPLALLTLCAQSRDHEPLIFALQWLFSHDWPTTPEEQAWLAHFLLKQPDSAGLQVALLLDHLLSEHDEATKGSRERIAALLLQCVEHAPLERLQLFCLLDRPLLRYFPQHHQTFLDQLQSTCQKLLTQGQTDAITEAMLLKLPASRVAALQPPPVQAANFRALLQRAAHDAIEVLAAVPKPISQARAEELLSRRVYDDPGHFLFELLQNAEDQQARRWCLHFGPSEIFVWHDGLPFDARDLVGVTSIGQSNKKRHQIGFFGVGFKSVYEITRRPQIYSDAYQFEIADVSMPRALDSRPIDLPPSMPPNGTLLILPLREQDHEARSPQRLYLRTHALDPVILLTLRSIEHIETTLEPSLLAHLPPQTAPMQRLTLQGDRQSARVTIQRNDPPTQQHYLLASTEISVDAGLRSTERASHTRLLLGMACDPSGVPQPLPPKAPRLYSFLPTAEDPGLSFFLQAHFDVPVDRERILRDSPWNHYLLEQVPALFLQMAQELFSQTQQSRDSAPLRGFLRLLPLQEHLHDPLWRSLADALPRILSKQPIFPDITGILRSPQALYIAPPNIAQLLETIPLPHTIFAQTHDALSQTHDAPPERWPASLDIRSEETLRLHQLGVPTFSPTMWPDLLESWLREHPEGTQPPVSLAFLFASPQIDRLYQQLTTLLQTQSTEDPVRYQASLQRLRSLPLLIAEDGGLYSAAQGKIALASPVLRQAWGTQQRFLSQDLQDHASDLFQHLGVPTRNHDELLHDLSLSLGTTDITPQEYAQRWPVARDVLLHSLSHATEAERKAFSRLPLFLTHDQRLAPLALTPHEHGVFHLPPSPAYDALFALLSPRFSLFADDPSLLASFSALSLHPPQIIDLITHHATMFQTDLHDLHAAIGQIANHLTHAHFHALCEAPLWLTTQQRITSIHAPDAPLLTRDLDLPRFLPTRDFVHPSIASQAHIPHLPIPLCDILDLFDAILATDPPLDLLQSYLLQHAPRLRTLPLAQRAKAPLFVDQHGTRQSAQTLSRSPAPAWLPFLQRRGERRYLAAQPAEQSALLQALDLESALIPVDPPVILREAFQQLHTFEPQEKQLLLDLIAQHIDDLPFAILDQTRKAPIFPDSSEKYAPLADWNKTLWRDHIPDHLIFRCDQPLLREIFEQAGFRILSAHTQDALHPLFQHLSLRDAALSDLLDLLRHTSPQASWLQVSILPTIRRFLQQRIEELRTLFPPQSRLHRADGHPDLESLPLFSNQHSQPTPLSQLTDSPSLDALWADQDAWRTRRLHPEEKADLAAFSGLMAPASLFDALRETLLEIAQPLRPLTEQIPPLASLAALQQQIRHLAPLCSTAALHDLPLWADRRLRLRKGPLFRQGTQKATWLEGLPITSDLLHPTLESDLSDDLRDTFSEISAFHLLDAFSSGSVSGQPVEKHHVLGSTTQREHFYDFLLQRWETLCADERSAKRLRTTALFTSEQGDLHTLYEIDWSEPPTDPRMPRPESLLPSELRQCAARHLLEHPLSVPEQARTLFARLLESAEQNNHDSFDRTYAALAHLWQHAPPAQQKQMLQAIPQEELLFPDPVRRWLPLSRAMLPKPADLDDLTQLFGTSSFIELPKHPAATTLAYALGIAKQPDDKQLRQKLAQMGTTEDYKAFARYLNRHPQSLPPESLRNIPWMLDDQQMPRDPSDLFWFDERIQRLTLHAPGLFPAPFYEDLLPAAWIKPLRFRSIKDLGLSDVLAPRPDDSILEPDVLLWLERGLEDRRFARDALQTHASRLTLLCQDGQPRHPRLVLALPPTPLFAEMRGFWPEGAHRYPLLCKALAIPTQLSSDLIRNFLESIGQSARHDPQILHKHPALLDALPRCYAALQQQSPQHPLHTSLPVFLAERITPHTTSSDTTTATPDKPDVDPTSLLPSDKIDTQKKKTPPPHKNTQIDPSRYTLLHSAAKGFFVCQRPTLIAPYRNLSFALAALGPADIASDTAAFLLACGIPAFEQSISVKLSSKAGKDTTQRHTEALDNLRTQLAALRSVLPRVQAQRGGTHADWIFAEQIAALLQPNAIHVFQGLHVKATLKDVGKLDIPESITYDPQKQRLMLDEKILRSLSDATPRLAATLAPLVHRDPQEHALSDMIELLLRCGTHTAMQQYLDQRHFPRAVLSEKNDKKKKSSNRSSASTDFYESDTHNAHTTAFANSPEEDTPQTPSQGFFRNLWSRVFGNNTPKDNPTAESPDTTEAQTPSPEKDRSSTPPKNKPTPPKPTPPKAPPRAERPQDDANDDTAPRSRFFDAFNRLDQRSPRPSKQHDPADSLPFDPTEDRGSPPSSRPDEWNRPNDSIGPQLDFDAHSFRQHAANPQEIGLFHQPTTLPLPYRYALQTITGFFDPRTQHWSPTPLKAPLIWQSGPKVGSIIFQGKLPPGLLQLPMPLHSTRTTPPEITCNGESVAYKQKSTTPETWQIHINAPSIATIRYTLDLFSPPTIASKAQTTLNKHYLHPTTRREDLPSALQDFLAEIQESPLSDLEKARKIEQLVRKRYLYDMDYSKRSAVRAAREQLDHDRTYPQNDSLLLLHAGRHGAYWGAGVCHGLNILIAEMLRQVGIPSAIATCWVLDEGYLSRPDHLIALALLPTEGGFTALPLDGAVNNQGRVLHSASPPAPTKTPNLPHLPPPDTQRAALLTQIALYQRLLAHLNVTPSLPPLDDLDLNALQRQFQHVRQLLLDALGSKHLLHRLLAILDAGEIQTEHLDPSLQTLLECGLIEAQQHTTWQIRPRD